MYTVIVEQPTKPIQDIPIVLIRYRQFDVWPLSETETLILAGAVIGIVGFLLGFFARGL